MRTLVRLVFELAFHRYWRRRLADQYAILVADVGLTLAEEQALLTLRRSR